MKKLMILGASILQLPAILLAKDMGLTVVAVDMDERAVGFGHADIRLVISTIDEDRVLEAAKSERIDGIMTLASDMPMRSVARVAEAMGLPGVSLDTAIKATNKRAMRECLRDAGVPIPHFWRGDTEPQFLDAAGRMPGRFIVKPANNSGSRGVSLVETSADPEALRLAFAHARAFARGGEILVEEYMQGAEVSVEGISVRGVPHLVQITDKLTTGAPYFVEMGHSQPSRLPQDVQADIRRVAEAAIRAVGIVDGPSHTEIIATGEGAKIVEIGARLGGDCINSHLVPLSTGVNIVEAAIRVALGEAPNLVPRFEKGSAIRYFEAELGVISSIEGLDRARALEGVTEISFTKGTSDEAREIQSSTDRVGFVIAQANTARQAVEVCEQARQMVRVHTQRKG